MGNHEFTRIGTRMVTVDFTDWTDSWVSISVGYSAEAVGDRSALVGTDSVAWSRRQNPALSRLLGFVRGAFGRLVKLTEVDCRGLWAPIRNPL
jgi:hypothetical protein